MFNVLNSDLIKPFKIHKTTTEDRRKLFELCSWLQLLFFCKYTRNVYKSTVETSVQCKLSKLKRNITLKSFCTSHDKGGLSFSAAKQIHISQEETSVSDFRTLHGEMQLLHQRAKCFRNTDKKKDGMALVLISDRRASFIEIVYTACSLHVSQSSR